MERKIGFGQALKLFWKQYVNFKGRARRSEYWFMALWHLIFMVPVFILYIIGLVIMVSGFSVESDGVGCFRFNLNDYYGDYIIRICFSNVNS